MKRTPQERVFAITAVLDVVGEQGIAALQLADRADVGTGNPAKSRRDALAREIRHLRLIGLDIRNIAPEGDEARYVLHPRDTRFQMTFDAAEQTELARAALRLPHVRAGLGDPGGGVGPAGVELPEWDPPAALETVLAAVTGRCRLAFTYSNRRRELSPYNAVPAGGSWTVNGREHDSGRDKTFDIRRMRDVTMDAPGTARVPEQSPRPSPDPLTWHHHDPITATISCRRQYLPDAVDLLRVADVPGSRDQDEVVTTTVEVTNRDIFVARLIEMAERVRLEGPDDMRDLLRARLEALL